MPVYKPTGFRTEYFFISRLYRGSIHGICRPIIATHGFRRDCDDEIVQSRPTCHPFRFRVLSVSSVQFYHYDFLRSLHLESFEFYVNFSEYNFKEGGF